MKNNENMSQQRKKNAGKSWDMLTCPSPAGCHLETTCKADGGPGTRNSPESLLLEQKTAIKS
jgi:hypothetical protein